MSKIVEEWHEFGVARYEHLSGYWEVKVKGGLAHVEAFTTLTAARKWAKDLIGKKVDA